MIKGWPTQGKQSFVGDAQFATVEPVRTLQQGLSTLSHMFVREVTASVAVVAGSTTQNVVATSHGAKRGDVVRFLTGALAGYEVKVAKVTDANNFVPGEQLESAPANGDTFQLLRHKYPTVAATGSLSLTPGPLEFLRNGSSTQVAKDTGTPANNRPLPVELLDINGRIAGINASNELSTADATARTSLSSVDGKMTSFDLDTGGGTQNVQGVSLRKSASGGSVELGTSTDPVRTDPTGTTTQPVSAASLPLPTGAATEATLAALSAKFGTLGQKNMAGSAPVVIASDQSAVPVSQSGTWNVTNISGTVSLPTGAATEATLAALNNKVATFDLDTGAGTQNVQGVSLRKSASGGSVELGTSTDPVRVDPVGTTQQPIKDTGRSVVTTHRRDYSSGNVTTGAWVELVASLGADVHALEIFDGSGQTMELGIGAAAAEARLILIPPGGNSVLVPVKIASGTRVSIRAVSGTANAGEIDINFYGVNQ